MGRVSYRPTICPIDPLTYPASKLFFTNITRAHFLRTRVSGARHHFLIASTSFSAHFDCISNTKVTSWIWLSRSLLYVSTEIFRVKSSVWSSVSTTTFRDWRSSWECWLIDPDRISFNIWRSGSSLEYSGSRCFSPTCRYCTSSTQIASRNVFQTEFSNANSTSIPRETGGNWKKSPTNTTWIPPNGSWENRVERSSRSRFARNIPDNIEISSIMRIFVLANLFARYSLDTITSISSSVSVSRIPIPLHEWIVIPPMCVAAMPVEAVTAIVIPCSLACLINRLIRKVFPVPAAPVKNTLCPIASMSNAWSWVMPVVYPKMGKDNKKYSLICIFFIYFCNVTLFFYHSFPLGRPLCYFRWELSALFRFCRFQRTDSQNTEDQGKIWGKNNISKESYSHSDRKRTRRILCRKEGNILYSHRILWNWVPSEILEVTPVNPLLRNSELYGTSHRNLISQGSSCYRKSQSQQSYCHHHPLSSCHRKEWQTHRIWWLTRTKNLASRTREKIQVIIPNSWIYARLSYHCRCIQYL